MPIVIASFSEETGMKLKIKIKIKAKYFIYHPPIEKNVPFKKAA